MSATMPHMPQTAPSIAQPVRRRRVFYIPGYDPFHPRRYRELYRREGADQARISGYALTLSPKTGATYGWSVAAEIAGARVETQVDVLVWSDLVRGSMGQSIAATYAQLLRTAWTYIGSGALFRLMRLRKGPTIAALYPVVFLLAQLGLALALGYAGFGLILWGVTALGGAVWLGAGLGIVAGIGLGLSLLRWFRAHDNKVFAYYLMHDYAYSARTNGANPPDLEARMFDFQQSIKTALAEDYDEVLVVGHSSGAHLAVSILADVIREEQATADLPPAQEALRAPPAGAQGAALAPRRPAFSFLSLGQVVPMVSFLPEAKRLRADLRFLSACDALTWVDVTAPGDGCAFALCDPVSVSGVAPAGKRWPLVLSCAFTQSLSPARWAALRWRFFRLHFQYLCAFDRPKDYDYFQITAGPVTLGARYAERAPSKSRIEAPCNRYTSVA